MSLIKYSLPFLFFFTPVSSFAAPMPYIANDMFVSVGNPSTTPLVTPFINTGDDLIILANFDPDNLEEKIAEAVEEILSKGDDVDRNDDHRMCSNGDNGSPQLCTSKKSKSGGYDQEPVEDTIDAGQKCMILTSVAGMMAWTMVRFPSQYPMSWLRSLIHLPVQWKMETLNL